MGWHIKRVGMMRIFVSVVLLLIAIGMVAGGNPVAAQSCASPNWEAKFYNNVNLSGTPVYTTCTPVIDFNWGVGAPAGGVNIDNFSVRLTSTQTFPAAGSYAFTATVEDGLRLYVNGAPLINSMIESDGPRTLNATYNAPTAGTTAFLTLEMANWVGNAQLRLVWSLASGGGSSAPPTTGTGTTTTQNFAPVPTSIPVVTADQVSFGNVPTGGGRPWTVLHYASRTPSGNPIHQETAPADGISRNYEGNAPLSSNMDVDNWSSRWEREVDFPAGRYTFSLQADDGGRVTVDGKVVINQPEYDYGKIQYGTVELDAGTHTVVVEHYEFSHNANIMVSWDPPFGTSLFLDGCNGATAGIFGGAAPCPERGVAFVAPTATSVGLVRDVASGGGQKWAVEYFNNTSFSGAPVATDQAPANGISRNYGGGVPARSTVEGQSLEADFWSARWTRLVDFEAGIYTFTLRADDAARVSIDNTEILNQAQYVEGASFTVNVEIPAGRHQLVVEHIEEGDQASLFLTWEPPIGTDLRPDGCNGETAGVNGSAPPCIQPTALTAVTLPVTVRAGPLHFRPGPARASGSLRFLRQGEQYTAIGRSFDNVWIQLQVGTTTGWSMTEFLTLQGDINSLLVTDGTVDATAAQTNTTQSEIRIVGQPTTIEAGALESSSSAALAASAQAEALGHMRLRAEPSESAARVGGVEYGAVVGVLGRTSDSKWLFVDYNGVQGWTATDWYRFIRGSVGELPILN